MIVGVGVDVVDVERFGATLTRTPGLRERLFTAAETGMPLGSLAARFAAKEALAKALGAPAGAALDGCRGTAGEGGRPRLDVRDRPRRRPRRASCGSMCP